MPDWFTHVAVMYVLMRGLVWQVDSLESYYVPIGMVGGLLPDMAKVQMFVPGDAVSRLLGVPFSWTGFASLWGSLLVAGMITLLVTVEERRKTLGVLALGLVVHILLDSLNRDPGPQEAMLFEPITLVHTPEVYLSSDAWLSVASGVLALAVWIVGNRERLLRGRKADA